MYGFAMHRRAFLALGGSVIGSGCLGYTVEREEDIKSLEDEITELEGDLGDAEQQVLDAESSVEELESQLDDRSNEITDLESQLDDRTDEIADLEDEKGRLESEVEGREELVSDLRGELEDTEASQRELFIDQYSDIISIIAEGVDWTDTGRDWFEGGGYSNAARYWLSAGTYFEAAAFASERLDTSLRSNDYTEAADMVAQVTQWSTHARDAYDDYSQAAREYSLGNYSAAEEEVDSADEAYNQTQSYTLTPREDFEAALKRNFSVS